MTKKIKESIEKAPDGTVTCTTFPRKKVWPVAESEEKPGYAICPACGKYHKEKKY